MKNVLFATEAFRRITMLMGALVACHSVLMAQSADRQIPAEWPTEWKKEAERLDLGAIQTGLFLNYALLSGKQLK